MKQFTIASLGILVSMASLQASTVPSAADDVSSKTTASTAAFGRMSTDQIKERLQQWLTLARTDEAAAGQAMELWAIPDQINGLTAEQTLDRLIDSFAIADKSVQQLVEACRSAGTRKAIDFEG